MRCFGKGWQWGIVGRLANLLDLVNEQEAHHEVGLGETPRR